MRRSGTCDRGHGGNAGISGDLSGAVRLPGRGGHYLYSYERPDCTGGGWEYRMEWISDELLFYGGMAAAGCSLLAMILYLCISQIKKVRLSARLDAEYGERKKK